MSFKLLFKSLPDSVFLLITDHTVNKTTCRTPSVNPREICAH